MRPDQNHNVHQLFEVGKRLAHFRRMIREVTNTADAEFVSDISNLMNDAFIAGLHLGRSEIVFDPEDKAPTLPIMTADIHSSAQSAISRLRKELFGRTIPADDRNFSMGIRGAERLVLVWNKDDQVWEHSDRDMEPGSTYTEPEVEALANLSLIRRCLNGNGKEIRLVSRWGFELIYTGRTSGERRLNDPLHEIYDSRVVKLEGYPFARAKAEEPSVSGMRL